MEQLTYQSALPQVDDRSFPVAYQFAEATPVDSFIAFYKANQAAIAQKLLETGAIVFSGLDIARKDDFQGVMDAISTRFMSYVDGNSPRTKLSDQVYTSTEYDPRKTITLHNELSYSAKWPSNIFFCCLLPAETGGETPIADGREVLRRMEPQLVADIEDKGLLYIRNLHGGSGLGPSWQDTFETTDPLQVEQYCRQYATQYAWQEDGGIRLVQPSKGIIRHPVTGEKVWFNQIDQFHPSHMSPEVYQTLMQIFPSVEDLPMFVKFGDGSFISDQQVKGILATIDAVAVDRRWQRGDLLLLDNVLISHGRRPFTGKRQVLVSMTE